jgi:hypothetical protein
VLSSLDDTTEALARRRRDRGSVRFVQRFAWGYGGGDGCFAISAVLVIIMAVVCRFAPTGLQQEQPGLSFFISEVGGPPAGEGQPREPAPHREAGPSHPLRAASHPRRGPTGSTRLPSWHTTRQPRFPTRGTPGAEATGRQRGKEGCPGGCPGAASARRSGI